MNTKAEREWLNQGVHRVSCTRYRKALDTIDEKQAEIERLKNELENKVIGGWCDD